MAGRNEVKRERRQALSRNSINEVKLRDGRDLQIHESKMANRTSLRASVEVTTDRSVLLTIGTTNVLTVGFTKLFAETTLEIQSIGHSMTSVAFIGGAAILVVPPGGTTSRYRLGAPTSQTLVPLHGTVTLTGVPAGSGTAGISVRTDRDLTWYCREVTYPYNEFCLLRVFERP